MLSEMADRHSNSYFGFVMARSQQYRQQLLEQPLSDLLTARFSRMASESMAKQHEIESTDTMPFELFRRQYISQDMTGAILERQQG
jgi:glutamate--cysteine ligase